MGKKKRNGDQRHLKKKIRRLEKQLRRYSSSSSYSSEDEEYRSATPEYFTESENSIYSREENTENNHTPGTEQHDSEQAGPSTATTATSSAKETVPVEQPLPADILEALGEAKGKPEVFGPKIQEEVSKRWGRILSEGLNKDQKKVIMDKLLVPENFALVKAPNLNPEISAVLTESARNRDKRLERAQQHLGLGIAGLTSTISNLIDGGDLDKLDLIKKLFEINQILLDLHFESTINRRKLIIPILDKKFLNMIQDVKRDKFLFGEGLGDKIKATKTAEKSGLQIKKAETREASTSKKYPAQQGNWRGPPRQAQRVNKPSSGPRTRSSYQNSKRTGQTATDRYQAPSKTTSKPTTKTQ